jgi:hypothetical protein
MTMARIRCDFHSDTLGFGTSMTVLLPERAKGRPTEFPTLYLLHGLSDDDTAWSRFTPLESYAAELNLAIVMPQVHRSFYTDEVWGHPYWTFIAEELPRTARALFRLTDDRRRRSWRVCPWVDMVRSSSRCAIRSASAPRPVSPASSISPPGPASWSRPRTR